MHSFFWLYLTFIAADFRLIPLDRNTFYVTVVYRPFFHTLNIDSTGFVWTVGKTMCPPGRGHFHWNMYPCNQIFKSTPKQGFHPQQKTQTKQVMCWFLYPKYDTENHTEKSNHTEKPLKPHWKTLQKIRTLKISV